MGVQQRLLLSLVLLFSSFTAKGADLTLNIGYHNPPSSTIGVNFLWFLSPKWAAELGVGWAQVESQNTDSDSTDDTLAAQIAGDFNLKFFLSQGAITPYLQGGLGLGAGAQLGHNIGSGLAANGPFGGLGLLFGSKKLYAYASINLDGQVHNFVQFGLGVDI